MLSQSAVAYDKIREKIFKMELMPGDRIPEMQLSTMLNISRTPIHDALRRLQADGLVVISPNRGASVRVFSDEEVRELGTLRLSMDILASSLASYYGSARDFENLSLLAEKCENVASEGDVYGRIQSDLEFHMAIAAMTNNQQLMKQQRALFQQIHLIQISRYTDIESSLAQIRHHRPMIDAMKKGDLSTLRELICEHIMNFYNLDPFLYRCYCTKGTAPAEISG